MSIYQNKPAVCPYCGATFYLLQALNVHFSVCPKKPKQEGKDERTG